MERIWYALVVMKILYSKNTATTDGMAKTLRKIHQSWLATIGDDPFYLP